jgi:hypothetical protein
VEVVEQRVLVVIVLVIAPVAPLITTIFFKHHPSIVPLGLRLSLPKMPTKRNDAVTTKAKTINTRMKMIMMVHIPPLSTPFHPTGVVNGWTMKTKTTMMI